MVIGATHTPSSRLYAPPNFISIPPQRPSSRWTTASHSKPELSLFPHSKILEKKAKALLLVHQVEWIDSKTPTGYRSVNKMPSGGAISLGACTAIGQPRISLSTEVAPQSTLPWDSKIPKIFNQKFLRFSIISPSSILISIRYDFQPWCLLRNCSSLIAFRPAVTTSSRYIPHTLGLGVP